MSGGGLGAASGGLTTVDWFVWLATGGADVLVGCVTNAVAGGNVETELATPLGGVNIMREPSNAVKTTRTASPDEPTMATPPI